MVICQFIFLTLNSKMDHFSSLDNLCLGNLNQKLATMRDKLRDDIAQDLQYMHLKMNFKSGRDSEASASNPSAATSSIRNEEDYLDQFGNNLVDRLQKNASQNYQNLSEAPQYYINTVLVQQPIDMEEIKRISSKKISEAQWDEYIKCSLKRDVVDKLKELFDQLQDKNQKVLTRDFVNRINKMGIKYSEASAIQVPIIKRVITLKKVLFELYFKTKKLPQRTTWREFKQSIQDYRFPSEPTIDAYMASQGVKAKNHFNLPPEIVNQLKSIYFKSSKEMFLSYCPISALLSKLDRSKVIQNNFKCMVRPKGNYEVQVSLKDTINYITSYAPEFIDQDQFLLFFTVKGFSFYPIQQRKSTGFGSSDSDNNKPIKRIKSDHYLPKDAKKKHLHFDEYYLSTNNPNSIRNQKLKEMIQEQSVKKQSQSKSFKARPMPKSISKQKYEQFVNGMQYKLQQGRKNIQFLRSQSQRELQRLKSQTKLFIAPKKQQIEQNYYHITARPLPSSIKSPRLNQIENERITRRNKIMSQTQIKYQNSWKQLPFVATLDLSPKRKQSPPKQNYKLQIREIPNYEAQQQRIQQELQQRKHQFHPTQPEPFYFHTDARHQKVHYQHSELPQPIDHYDYKEIIYSQEPDIYYTQKFADMVVANKKKAEEKQKKAKQLLEEEIERQKRHQNFGKFMKSNLRKIPDTAKICENQAKIKIERHKKYWKNLDREHQDNLNQIYAKILKRPFLYQLQSASAQQNQQNVKNQLPKKQKKTKNSYKRSKNRSL